MLRLGLSLRNASFQNHQRLIVQRLHSLSIQLSSLSRFRPGVIAAAQGFFFADEGLWRCDFGTNEMNIEGMV